MQGFQTEKSRHPFRLRSPVYSANVDTHSYLEYRWDERSGPDIPPNCACYASARYQLGDQAERPGVGIGCQYEL